MYVPSAFRAEDLATLHEMIRAARLANLVTVTDEGLFATPLPLVLMPDEGPNGTLYGHIARANPHWKLAPRQEALAILSGPDAYITPSWYAAKREHGKVVPTWNYVAVHAYGPVEFFDDADRLLEVVTKLTDLHETPRETPWAVDDAPKDFVHALLRAIVGVRLPITRLEGKRKLSQNRPAADRAGVIAGLAASTREGERTIAGMVPE